MTDRFDEQMFLDYVEGDLNQEQIEQFESLLEQDSSLRTLVTTVISDRQLLRLAAKEPAPPDLMDQAHSHLERHMLLDTPSQELGPMAPQHRFRLGQYVAIGGLAALVLVSTAVVVHTLIDRNLYDRFAPSTDPKMSLQEQKAPETSIIQIQPTPELLAMGESQLADLKANKPASEPVLIEPIDTLTLAGEKSKPHDTGDAIMLELSKEALEPSGTKKSDISTLSRLEDAKSPKSTEVPTDLDSPKPSEQQDAIQTFARLTKDETETSTPTRQLPSSLAKRVFKHMAKIHELESHTRQSETDGQRVTKKMDFPAKTIPTGKTQNPSTHQPSPVTVRVDTANATATQHALLVWALARDVRIVSLTDAVAEKSIHRRQSAGINHKDIAPRRMILAMTTTQFHKLLPLLNTADQSIKVLAQVVQIPRVPVEVGSDDSPLKQIPRFAELDWAKILEPNIPLRRMVPTFSNHAQLMLTVEIYESQQDGLGPDHAP